MSSPPLPSDPYQVNATLPYPNPYLSSTGSYPVGSAPVTASEEPKKKGGISSWLIVAIILAVIIVVVVLGWILFANLTSEADNSGGDSGGDSGDSTVEGSLGDLCTDNTNCSEDLVCSGGRCLKPIGATCTSLDECTLEANVCNGLCGISQVDTLGGSCPCISKGLVPVETTGGCICLGGEGFLCESNSDCVSGKCNFSTTTSVCAAPRTEGQTCGSGVGNCEDGLTCSSGFCQVNGVNTGGVGAYCENNQPFPSQPGQTAPGCEEGTTCYQNTCILTAGDLGTVCYASIPSEISCGGPLLCIAGECSYAVNVNACKDTNCTAGYQCNTRGVCLAKNGQPCSGNSSCLSGNCTYQPSVFSWQYSESFINKGFQAFSGTQAYTGESPLTSFFPVNTNQTNPSTLNTELYAEDLLGNIWFLPKASSTAALKWQKILQSSFMAEVPGKEGKMATFEVNTFVANYATGFTLIAFRVRETNPTASYEALYEGYFDSGTYQIRPFNVTNEERPGEQYIGNESILITSIDVSTNPSSNPDVIISGLSLSNPNFTIFTKPAGQSVYSAGPVRRRPRFYKAFSPPAGSPLPSPPSQSRNYCYVADDGLIHFSGQLESLTGEELTYPTDLPDGTSRRYNVSSYSIWSNPGSEGINDAYLWIVAKDISSQDYMLFYVRNGQFQLPGYYNDYTTVGANNLTGYLAVDKVCQ